MAASIQQTLDRNAKKIVSSDAGLKLLTLVILAGSHLDLRLAGWLACACARDRSHAPISVGVAALYKHISFIKRMLLFHFTAMCLISRVCGSLLMYKLKRGVGYERSQYLSIT